MQVSRKVNEKPAKLVRRIALIGGIYVFELQRGSPHYAFGSCQFRRIVPVFATITRATSWRRSKSENAGNRFGHERLDCRLAFAARRFFRVAAVGRRSALAVASIHRLAVGIR